MTARGRLERRELLLVRLWARRRHRRPRRDGAARRCGAAPSLARIAGELAGVCRVLAEGEPVGWNRRAALIEDCARAEVPRQALAAIDIATLDLVGKSLGVPGLAAARRRRTPRPVRVQRDAGRRRAGRRRRARARRGPSAASRPSSSRSASTGDVEQVAAVRAAVGARGARSGSTPTAPGRSTRRASGSRQMASRTRAGRAAGRDARGDGRAARARSTCRWRPTRASPARTTRAARRAWRPADCATVKLAKVGGVDAALAVAAELPVYLSSALDGPVGIAAAAHVGQALRTAAATPASRTASRPRELFDGHDRLAASASSTGDELHRSPTSPGLGVEIDEDALDRHRIALDVAARRGRDQPQHRARLGARRRAGARRASSTPASRPGSRSRAARARALASSRACASGATWTSAAPASSRSASRSRPASRSRRADHLRDRRRQPAPRGRRGVRGARAADRRSRPTGRPSCAGAAPARRSTSSSSTARRVRWFCELGVQQADDTGLLHVRCGRGACRGGVARRARPGRCTSTSRCRSRSRPTRSRATCPAEDPLAREGRPARRPLTLVLARRSRRPDDELVVELARADRRAPRAA